MTDLVTVPLICRVVSSFQHYPAPGQAISRPSPCDSQELDGSLTSPNIKIRISFFDQSSADSLDR